MERSVVAGVDGSEASLGAAEWAAAEARRRGLRLCLLMAFPAPSPEESAFVWSQREIDKIALQALDQAEERVSATAPDLGVDRLVVREAPTHALLQKAREESTALVVVGPRGRGGFPGLKLGSVAYRVAAHSPTPVVVMGGEPQARERTEVVVGQGGSVHGERPLAEAFEAAAASSQQLRVVRVWEWPLAAVSPLVPRTATPEETNAAEGRDLEEALAPWRRRYPSVHVHTEVVEGRAAEVLEGATRNSRLAVVGASGLHGLTRFALGSTAHGLLHHAHCPVMVVHPG
ncbi:MULTISPECIES: universal stress protein [unclassified Nocardiopsis]|uniref:universal stress protein n=1 Tax=unclassified Nocardiopsis TaxID=2649073 RepID=UPI00135CE07B|nr:MULTISPECIES: universal stress protein [unclassified Nocardiopsis]